MVGAQRQWFIKHFSATGTYGLRDCPRSVSGSHHYCGRTFLLGVWLPHAGSTGVPVCQPGMCAQGKTSLACTWGQTAISWFRKPRWLFFHFFLAIDGLSLLNNFLINKYSASSRCKDISNCQIRTITSLFNQPQFLYICHWNNIKENVKSPCLCSSTSRLSEAIPEHNLFYNAFENPLSILGRGRRVEGERVGRKMELSWIVPVICFNQAWCDERRGDNCLWRKVH